MSWEDRATHARSSCYIPGPTRWSLGEGGIKYNNFAVPPTRRAIPYAGRGFARSCPSANGTALG